ncbi:hypothetical protein HAX54_005538 [Datura stramonium]|uniref:Uncharacterized protein n=1 Tax=Datura stramonium TaxID=4076 RepID=A0ABS8TBE2_DATST|nr:hypothetical protein [Datura stramonium]
MFISFKSHTVDRASQLKDLSDENSYSIEDLNSRLWTSNTTESGERPNEASFSPEQDTRLREASADKDSKIEASLSSWLKPSSINQDEDQKVSWHATPFERTGEDIITRIFHFTKLAAIISPVLNKLARRTDVDLQARDESRISECDDVFSDVVVLLVIKTVYEVAILKMKSADRLSSDIDCLCLSICLGMHRV